MISYEKLESIAEASSIFESKEILEAVRFLNDLGSLQYFESNALKDKVVINPQWIVNVMACVVSVKETCIQDGKLYHKDISKIWKDYSPDLYEWMLKLTEEFDLTFPVKSEEMNIVPCLLSEKPPVYEWPEINSFENSNNKIKEFKVVYSFSYIPAGLFNRIQVRLYQYGDSAYIWKSGSFLRKNNHIALITQTKNSTIELKVQGIKPENIIFLIHEVMETLISESFNGIKYDYSFPCPDCVETKVIDPCLFSSSLLKRASEFKAPFLQCNKFFHAISIQEMLSIMPVDGLSNLDLNLDNSIRDLKQLKKNLKYDIFFWYCQEDSPKLMNVNDNSNLNQIDPLKVLEAIKKEKFKIWYSKNPKEEKMDKLTYAIKESRLVVLGVSDNFSKDEKSIQVFELVKNIIRKNYFLIEFGKMGDHKWMENTQFASIVSDYRIIMQDPSRYAHKINDALESIETQLKDVRIDRDLEKISPDVFISYCWANSHDAVHKGTKGTKTSLGI